jgi:hypothetical protein
MAVFWDVAIALMMEAVNTSETSVSIVKTIRHNIPEDIHVQLSDTSSYTGGLQQQ